MYLIQGVTDKLTQHYNLTSRHVLLLFNTNKTSSLNHLYVWSLLNRMWLSQWNTLFFFTEFQFQWNLDAEESGELEEFLKVHLENHEDVFLSTCNYRKWNQDTWKPYTQCYKLIHWLHHNWWRKDLEQPGCAGINW